MRIGPLEIKRISKPVSITFSERIETIESIDAESFEKKYGSTIRKIIRDDQRRRGK